MELKAPPPVKIFEPRYKQACTRPPSSGWGALCRKAVRAQELQEVRGLTVGVLSSSRSAVRDPLSPSRPPSPHPVPLPAALEQSLDVNLYSELVFAKLLRKLGYLSPSLLTGPSDVRHYVEDLQKVPHNKIPSAT